MENNLTLLAHMYNEQYYTAHYNNHKDTHRIYKVKIDPMDIWISSNNQELSDYIDVEVRISALVRTSVGRGMKEIKWEGKLQDWYQALLNNTLEMASK